MLFEVPKNSRSVARYAALPKISRSSSREFSGPVFPGVLFVSITSGSQETVDRRYQTNQQRKKLNMKAIWNGQVIAESDETVVVDSNHYFPKSSLVEGFFKPSSTKSTCSWKGEASYFTISVNGKENVDAAWCYESPLDAAKNIANHVAFWKGVEVT